MNKNNIIISVVHEYYEFIINVQNKIYDLVGV